MELKSFTKYLVDKYWESYQTEIIGCGFPYSIEEDIKHDIRKYINENNLYDKYNKEDYINDTDEYAKFYIYRDIMTIFYKELEHIFYRDYYNTPKRYESYCPPRD